MYLNHIEKYILLKLIGLYWLTNMYLWVFNSVFKIFHGKFNSGDTKC